MGIIKAVITRPSMYPIARRVYLSVRRRLCPSGLTRNELYDIQTTEVMRRYLCRDSVCIDVGAHNGAILAEMIRIAPDGKHYAFEPLPHLAKHLKKRFKDVNIFECALSEKGGEEVFYFVKNAPAFSGLRQRTYDRSDVEIEEIRVEVRRMDDIISDNVDVRFIKMDIEGGEYHAMLGGSNVIKRCKPMIIFEAGLSSTSHYCVTPEMIYDLITSEFGLELSTMGRWLSRQRSLSKDEFLASYITDFYFVAYLGLVSSSGS